MGQHLGADMELLAELLPRIEPLIVSNINGDEPEPEQPPEEEEG